MTRRASRLATVIATAAVMAGAMAAPSGAAWTLHAKRSDMWSGLRTVYYPTADGATLAMSLFAPSEGQGPLPVVLEVHGGGWEEGGRIMSLAASRTATDLVNAGFMVASIDYRLAPAHPWPDQIIDVTSAVRYLRADALSLGIDPSRVGAWGDSAGGQLVSLLGTAPTNPAWDAGPNATQSSQVESVVDEFGPADLNADDWPQLTTAMIRNTFGSAPTANNSVLRDASPAHYAAPGDPPFMIVQGTADNVVPPSQSEELAAELRSAHVPVNLVLVKHGDHGLQTPHETPSQSQVSALITAFMIKTLVR